MSDQGAAGEKIIGDAELAALAARGVVKVYPKSAIIVSEGDDTDSLFVILEGRVKVYVSDEEGREVVLRTMGCGEYFGEMVLDGGPRSASVVTLEHSRFAILGRQRFREFLHEHPAFSIRLVEMLIQRTRALTKSVKSLALMDVYGRIARLLLELAVLQNGRLVIPEKLTQQDIASRVGSSREMVSRIFKDLVDGGYISIDARRITIHKNPPRDW